MTSNQNLTKDELSLRMDRFKQKMNTQHPEWETAIIISDINQYYFTGTMQQGVLIISRRSNSTLWVRNNYNRALSESNFEYIKKMRSFRDIAESDIFLSDTIYIEKKAANLLWYERFVKYFGVKVLVGIDYLLQHLRSVKTNYEIKLLKHSAAIHKILLEDKVPAMLREGMSETELAGEIFLEAMKMGHHGITRFSGFNGEMFLGNVSFSETSLYPTAFDGPAGTPGISPAVPYIGSHERKLKKGDIVFVDFAVGVDGYHTDKTQIYTFGMDVPKIVSDTYQICKDIMMKTAEMMRPGIIPSQLYDQIVNDLPETFQSDFMGYKDRTVKFLGHGIGLHIDEYPVIAAGFDEPFESGMVLAIEPKKGLEEYGMIGVEETFLIDDKKTICLTSDNPHIIVVN